MMCKRVIPCIHGDVWVWPAAFGRRSEDTPLQCGGEVGEDLGCRGNQDKGRVCEPSEG